MKKAILLFVFCFTALWLVAQTPEWQWAKQAGGTSDDSGNGIATDSSGNIYVTGTFGDTLTFGSTTLISSGESDIFIAKLDTNGNALWAKQTGGTGYDRGKSIATDSSGNCYVTGWFYGNATFGSDTLTSQGEIDIYIAKLDTNGNWLWAVQAGGLSIETGNCISTDSNGGIFVTGLFSGTATFGNTTLVSGEHEDVFITKLDTDGNWLWAKKASGTGFDYGAGLATDSNGNCYVTGHFGGSADFGSISLISDGEYDQDIFIAKLDTNGNWLWAKQAGSTIEDKGYAISTDSSGNCYVTGFFYSSATFGTTTLIASRPPDIFVAKLDTNGNWLWVRQVVGTGWDEGRGISTDSNGNSYITGFFKYQATFGNTILISFTYDFDIFVAKIDTNGNWLWAVQAEGTNYDKGYAIATDDRANIYATGYFSGTANFGATTLTSTDEDDYNIFVAKINSLSVDTDDYEVPPASFSLGQNSPNPFTASTGFSVEVSDSRAVYEVAVYDLRGRHVCTLHRGALPAGKQSFTWNGKDSADKQLGSGVYFYRVSNGASSQVKKMIYVR